MCLPGASVSRNVVEPFKSPQCARDGTNTPAPLPNRLPSGSLLTMEALPKTRRGWELRALRVPVLALSLLASTLLSAQICVAAQGDCGQPQSDGTTPTATDALAVLQAAVGLISCDLAVCDVDSSCAITASDALLTLTKAVGGAVDLNCDCNIDCTTISGNTSTTTTTMFGDATPGCTSMQLILTPSGDVDHGWKGTGHNSDTIVGASVGFDVQRRCSTDDLPCTTDDDCSCGGTCRATCDCNQSSGDTECEIVGPTDPTRCVADMSVLCNSNDDCSGAGGECAPYLGPPLPLAASGVPICVVTYFQEQLTGTADYVTGAVVGAALLRSRVYLGINLDTPCPRCGASSGLNVGDTATCEGGRNNGLACTVEAISPDFDGVSSDCPPDPTASVAGQGLSIRAREITTGTVSQTANRVCGSPFDGFHPSSGTAACLDDFSACSSNVDCPDSVCGVYCHCGFCDHGDGVDPSEPCFDDIDCNGGTCSSNPGDILESQENANACQSLICGEVNPDECCVAGEEGCSAPTGMIGECNETPASCSNDGQCVVGGNGDTCILSATSCFETTITRSGTASPLGSYCVDDPLTAACTSNADCAAGACVPDTAEPRLAALYCIPAVGSSAINSAAGWPGPAAIELQSAVIVCRCGDAVIGCNEDCDDGNNSNGDGCDATCRPEL